MTTRTRAGRALRTAAFLLIAGNSVSVPISAQAGAVTNLTTSFLSTGTWSLNWSMDGLATPFIAHSTDNFVTTNSSGPGTVGQIAASFPSLVPDTTYYFKVKSSTEPDPDYVSLATATLAGPAVTLAPVFPSPEAAALWIQWSRGAPATGVNPLDTLYHLQYATIGTFPTPGTTDHFTLGAALLTGLTPGTSYYVQVRAVNRRGVPTGFNSFSSTFGVTSPLVAPPSGSYLPIPSTFTAVQTDNLNVNWTGTFPAQTFYKVQLATASDFTGTVQTSVTLQSLAVFTGLQPNATHYARINTVWSRTSSIPFPRADQAAGRWGKFIYFAGGKELDPTLAQCGFLNCPKTDVLYAPINANGTLGSWAVTSSLPDFRHARAVVVWNGWIYALGGSDGAGNPTFLAYSAPLNPTGGVGGWSALLSSLPLSLRHHGAAAYAGRLYVTGGFSAAIQDGVYFAPLQPDGTLGSWRPTTSLTPSLYRHKTVAWNGYLYVIGGDNGSGPVPDVRFAKILSDGTVGSWSATAALPKPLRDAAVAAADGRLYVIGGATAAAGGLSDSVYVASFNADGTLSPFASASPLIEPLEESSLVEADGRLYLLGGNSGSQARREVYQAASSQVVAEPPFTVLGATSTLPNPPSPAGFPAVTTGSLVAAWTPNGNFTPPLYEIRISSEGFGAVLASTQTLALSHEFQGLSPDVLYSFQGRAKGNSGTFSLFAPLGSTATLANPPVSPGFGTAWASSMTFTWAPNGNPSTTTYRLEVSTKPDLSEALVIEVTTTQVILSRLLPNAIHYFQVRAVNRLGVPTALAPGPPAGNLTQARVPALGVRLADGKPAFRVLGQLNFASGFPFLGAARLFDPDGTVLDSDNKLWVADRANIRVLRYSPPLTDGKPADLVLGQQDFVSASFGISASAMAGPRGIAMDAAGRVWVTDTANHRILRFSPPFVTGMNADLVLGQPNFSLSLPLTTASGLNTPVGLAFDRYGNVWAADSSNHRILRYSPPFKNGQAADLVLGQTGFTSGSPQTNQAGLNRPRYLAFDAEGRLWVSEALNHRVMRFKPPFASGMNADLVLGQPDFVTATSSSGAAGLNGPEGVAADPSDGLWVADSANHRILRFAPPFSTGQAASSVLGQTGFSGSAPSLGPNRLNGPTGLHVDSDGRVWSCDSDNHRVLGFEPSAFTAFSTNTLTLGWAGNPPGTEYLIELSSNSNFSIPSFDTGFTSATARTFGGLEVNTVYYARGRARNAALMPSSVVSFSSASTLSNPPTATQVVSVGTGTIALQWLLGLNPPTTLFETSRSTLTSFALESLSPQTTNFAEVLGGLAPGTTHYLRVRSVNRGGVPSPYDAAVTTRTLPVADRLVVTLPGEILIQDLGKQGVPLARTAGSSFTATVYATDGFSTVADTAPVVTLASDDLYAQIPAAKPLTRGATTFQVTFFTAKTVNSTATAAGLASGSSQVLVIPSTFTRLQVLLPGELYEPGSPSGRTGGPEVRTAGTSFDLTVRGTDLYWNLTAGAQDDVEVRAEDPIYMVTVQGVLQGGVRQLPASFLQPGTFSLIASDLTAPAISSHTSSPVTVVAADGVGTAAITPASASGCQAIIATITFTAQGTGLRAGGALALHVPEGWTSPAGYLLSTATFRLDYLHLVSTSAVFLSPSNFKVLVQPESFGGSPLGAGWVVLSISTSSPVSLKPGERLYLYYYGAVGGPPPFPRVDSFELRTRSLSQGALKPLASGSLKMSLSPGPARSLLFGMQEPLTLGPLQNSSTMQIHLADSCGSPVASAFSQVAYLSAFNYDALFGLPQQVPAQFFLESGVSTAALQIPAGVSRSTSFYVRAPASVSPSYFYARATATVDFNASENLRYVGFSTQAVSLVGVSVDTGVFTSASTQAELVVGPPGARAFINFTPVPAEANWEVSLATSPEPASPPVFRRTGLGDPSRTVSWAGEGPPGSVGLSPPGTHYATIQAGGGTVVNRSLKVILKSQAFIYGNLSPPGARAEVSATGSGATPVRFAQAGATGAFQIWGLQAGAGYRVQATTQTLVQGQAATVSVSCFSVVASSAGTDLGTLSFPTTAQLRLRAVLPANSPQEFFGKVSVYTPDFSRFAQGNLHFLQGSPLSDDGGRSFGVPASSWTVFVVEAGMYQVRSEVFGLNVSSESAGVTLSPGQTLDWLVPLPKKTSLYGAVVIPSTSPFGTSASIEGARPGERFPKVFGTAFIPASSGTIQATSAPFVLYGLDPGSWTLTARSAEHLWVSSAVFVVGSADLGSPSTSFLNLPLVAGGTLTGTVTVTGDTRQFPEVQNGAYTLNLRAYHTSSLREALTQVKLATSAVSATAGFRFTGLADGTYRLLAEHPALDYGPGGPPEAVVSGGAGSQNLLLERGSALLKLTLQLPPPSGGGCHPLAEFKNVALYLAPPGETGGVWSDATQIPGTALETGCTNLTLHAPLSGSGPYAAWGHYRGNGTWRKATAFVANRSTQTANLDFAGSTSAIAGTASLAGTVHYTTTAFISSLDSVLALLLVSPDVEYCILGSSAPVQIPAFHMELIPTEAAAFPGPVGPLKPRQPGQSCSTYAWTSSGESMEAPLLAYLAPVDPDGFFLFPSVATGTYLLRNSDDLDLNFLNGPELGQAVALVEVGTSSVLAGSLTGSGLRITPGTSLSGAVQLPPGVSDSRSVRVLLRDSLGAVSRQAILNFSGSNSVSYRFDRVSPGDYVLEARDEDVSRAYAARPRAVQVEGFPLQSQDLRLVRSGFVQGALALDALRADGTREFEVLTSSNAALLPSNLVVRALANPGFEGGVVGGRLLGDGRFLIQGLVPGSYDIEFHTGEGGPGIAFSTGAVRLVPTRRGGVLVRESLGVELGVVPLALSAQLAGRVTDAVTAKGLPNILVRAVPAVREPFQSTARGALPATLTDAEGRYLLQELSPLVRFYDVHAADPEEEAPGQAPGLYERAVATSVDLYTTSAKDFGLRPSAMVLTGRVLAASPSLFLGVPMGDRKRQPGALVFLQDVRRLPSGNPLGDIRVVTAPDGFFKIGGLAAGTYRLTASSLGHANLQRLVSAGPSTTDLGDLKLEAGSSVGGRIFKPDGSLPSEDEAAQVFAASHDMKEFLYGTLGRDPLSGSVLGYAVAGLRTGIPYRILLVSSTGGLGSPPEGAKVQLSSAGVAQDLDLTYVQGPPFTVARALKEGGKFKLQFLTSQPLRDRSPAESDPSQVLSKVQAFGVLSDLDLKASRSEVTGTYTPAQGEVFFALHLVGRTSAVNPSSPDSSDPNYLVDSTATFFTGVDAFTHAAVDNHLGGMLALEGQPDRLVIPQGAFGAGVSSGSVTFVRTASLSEGPGSTYKGSSIGSQGGPLPSLSGSYPPALVQAAQALAPGISPLSDFYHVALPLHLKGALARPAEMTVSYEAGADPFALNLYWYNDMDNTYVLQQDPQGLAPLVDPARRTITYRVSHFSTFVLLQSGQAVLTGSAYPGQVLEVFNFPNPFDLKTKTVSGIHGAFTSGTAVRGTMIHIGVPARLSGSGRVRIFNVAGERVRRIDLGSVPSGTYVYAEWDGLNDSGRDAASGVYIGEVEVGGESGFFKMALIK